MRLYRFPSIPIGLHQDEISEAYESYCLLHTGADRWGFRLPVYFLSWGSGQNVLQAYLTIPVLAVTGLTRVGARLIPLLCGLLTLPFFFFAVRRWHGDMAALSALIFLSFAPWQVMLTRWGIENSPLPFFLILGIFTFGVALGSRSWWYILPALLPFSLAAYTYGVVVVVLPGLLFLLFLLGYGEIAADKPRWLAAFAAFLLTSLPIAFFVLKNYITKRNYAFERWLPISVPLVPITRFSQIQGEAAARHPLVHNLKFAAKGLSDNISWFQVPGIRPLPSIVLMLAVVGFAITLFEAVERRKLSEPFLPLLAACLPLFLLFPLNISRGGSLFLPILALAGVGFARIFNARQSTAYRTLVGVICLSLFSVPTVKFAHAYFGSSYANAIRDTFYPDLPAAMKEVQQRGSAGAQIYITDKVTLNYVQTLFYMQVDPRTFQSSGATFEHPDFGPYHFSRASAEAVRGPLVFLLNPGEKSLCDTPDGTVEIGPFRVGTCGARP